MSPHNQRVVDLTDGNNDDKKNKPTSVRSRDSRIPTSQHQSSQHSVAPFASMPPAPSSRPTPRQGGPRASSFQQNHGQNSQPHRLHPNRDNVLDHQQGRKRKRKRTRQNTTNTQPKGNRNKCLPSQLEQHQHRESYKRQRFGRPGNHKKRPLPHQKPTKSNGSVRNAVYIEGIPSDFSPDQLRQFLVSQGLGEGSIQDVRLPTSQDSGSSHQGSGYVVLNSSASFHQALVLSGLRLGSGHIRVVPAKKLPNDGQPKRVATATEGSVQMKITTVSHGETDHSVLHSPENNSTDEAVGRPEGISYRNELRGPQWNVQSEETPNSPQAHMKTAIEVNLPLVVDLVSSSDSEDETLGGILNDSVASGRNSLQAQSLPLQQSAATSTSIVDRLHDTMSFELDMNTAEARAVIGEPKVGPMHPLASRPLQQSTGTSTTIEAPQEITVMMELELDSEKVIQDTREAEPVPTNGIASPTLQHDAARSPNLGESLEDDVASRFEVITTEEHVHVCSNEPLEVGVAAVEARATGKHIVEGIEKVGSVSASPLVPSPVQDDKNRAELEVQTEEEHMDANTEKPLGVDIAAGSKMDERDKVSHTTILQKDDDNATSPTEPLVCDIVAESEVSTTEVLEIGDSERAGLWHPHESKLPFETPAGSTEPLVIEIASDESLAGNRHQRDPHDDKDTDENSVPLQFHHPSTVVENSSPKPTSKRVTTSEMAINSFLEQVHGFQNNSTESVVDSSNGDGTDNEHNPNVCVSSSQPDDDHITVVKVDSTPSPESNAKTSAIKGTNKNEKAPPAKRQRFRPVAPKRHRAPNRQDRDNADIPIHSPTGSTTTTFPERRYVLHSAPTRTTIQKKQEKPYDYATFRFATSEEAQREQDRLLREAAKRVRQKAQFHVTQGIRGFQASNISFSSPIVDINARYPSHWQFKDPYSRLGLPKGADMKLVKLHFRLLARIYHPDKSKTYETAAKFQAIAEAYHLILST